MEDQTREVLQQQRLEKRVKIAERLQIPILISAVLICWVFVCVLTGPQQMLAWVAVGVCIGSLVWQRAIWRELRNSLAHKSINDVKGLVSFLALANASGYKVAFDTKSRLDSLSSITSKRWQCKTVQFS
jgi:amino acid permease